MRIFFTNTVKILKEIKNFVHISKDCIPSLRTQPPLCNNLHIFFITQKVFILFITAYQFSRSRYTFFFYPRVSNPANEARAGEGELAPYAIRLFTVTRPGKGHPRVFFVILGEH